ncbi:Hypothetical_protein [Hexamita inflata]|uniref:Hypothetical_protein n=1 Tax=Hexamita inflata TaxID=28002 RepID=A0AA86NZ63_9EUKA|nr:Hypothetical protein HINF_LOCUS15713 [Hexamita inflata]
MIKFLTSSYVRDFSNVFSISNALQRLSQFCNAYWLALILGNILLIDDIVSQVDYYNNFDNSFCGLRVTIDFISGVSNCNVMQYQSVIRSIKITQHIFLVYTIFKYDFQKISLNECQTNKFHIYKNQIPMKEQLIKVLLHVLFFFFIQRLKISLNLRKMSTTILVTLKHILNFCKQQNFENDKNFDLSQCQEQLTLQTEVVPIRHLFRQRGIILTMPLISNN